MGVLPTAVRPFGVGSNVSPTNINSSQYVSFTENVALAVPLGTGLSTLSLLTFFGNAMVVNAIRTERKLHTVS